MAKVRRGADRGATLIEILVALALVAVLVGGTFTGIGLLRRARLREATTLVASAVRAAYAHASSSSRVTRLVIDFGNERITMQDTEGKLYLQQDRTGGAAGASDVEQKAIQAGEDLVEGPKKAKPEFAEVKNSALDAIARAREEQAPTGKELPSGVTFRQVEVQHEDEPVTSEQVYLYFWPGGQTERAAIQVQLGDQAPDGDVMTLSVKPLTGQVAIDNGPIAMKRPVSDEEATERE
jgi:general secretion pathway protein H